MTGSKRHMKAPVDNYEGVGKIWRQTRGIDNKTLTPRKVGADSTAVYWSGRNELGGLTLCRFMSCSFSIGRSTEFALGNYFLPLGSLIC